MNRILVLDAVTANSIAAGEVVERPASVVKELCENALDAGADLISVVIENGGIKRIGVTDNGAGMSFDEAALAFQQHATSKLKSITDLDSLVTMGFRGEALPSIAAVSKVELKTRTADRPEGTLVRVEGGRQVVHRACGAAIGTSVTVDSLFYNTPARYKFLKKDSTEAARVIDVVERLVLARPEVSFRLINNGKQVLHSPGNNDLASAIYSVFSKVSTANLIPLESTDPGPVAVAGYVAEPAQARKSRQWQFFFVNNRIIKSPLLTAALEEGFRSYLMKGRFPAAFIKLALPANLLDVNVHPQKTEVRFWDEKAVFSAINHAVKAALADRQGPGKGFEQPLPFSSESAAQPPALADFKRREQASLAGLSGTTGLSGTADLSGTAGLSGTAVPSAGQEGPLSAEQRSGGCSETTAGDKQQPADKEVFTRPEGEAVSPAEQPAALSAGNRADKQDNIRPDRGQGEASSEPEGKMDHTVETGPDPAQNQPPIPRAADKAALYQAERSETGPASVNIGSSPMDAVLAGRYVGILFATYIIIEGRGVFYLIDQHAAHEKINFERLMSLYRNKEHRSQPLLTPLSLDISTTEAALVEGEQDLFKQLGFEVELFGRDTALIRSVPITGSHFSPEEAVRSILNSLTDLPPGALADRASEAVYDMLATMACKASVKAHDRLSEPEVEALLKQMAGLDNPWQCPHGRPSVIEVRDYDLEKLFRRVV